MMQIGIIGLGLMGGSFGLGLKKSGYSVLGFDLDAKNRQSALDLGLIDEICEFERIKKCDVIILAIPVEAIISLMDKLSDVDEDTTIIDFGSTKEAIAQAIPETIAARFIPAHPMTGTEKHGPKAARSGLYEDKIVVLCDLHRVDTLHKNRAYGLFETVKMKIVTMDSSDHDLHAAFISHMPHALSFALAKAVLAQEDPKSILTLAAGGFKDMSRLAKSSPQMWSDIFKQNRQNMLRSLECLENELNKCKLMIEKDDYEAMDRWIKDANKLHHIL